MSSSDERSSGSVVLSYVAAAVAWYLTNYVANLLTARYLIWRTGQSLSHFRFDYSTFWAEHFGWGVLYRYGTWLSLAVPGSTIILFLLFRTEFSYRRALFVGSGIILAQWILTALTSLTNHQSLFAGPGLVFYLDRLWVILPGVLMAATAWRIDLNDEPGIA